MMMTKPFFTGHQRSIQQLQILAVMLFCLSMVACGWKPDCIKPTSYNLGEETVAVMGNAMVQQTVECLSIRYDPVGLHQTLWNRSPYLYNPEPRVLKELIYAGREGDTLHITYREYSVSGYARTPFYQQLYYDLKKSDEILFQENAIRVLDADNRRITFKVLQGWTPILK